MCWKSSENNQLTTITNKWFVTYTLFVIVHLPWNTAILKKHTQKTHTKTNNNNKKHRKTKQKQTSNFLFFF